MRGIFSRNNNISHVLFIHTYRLSMLQGPNPTKTRVILKHKLRTLQYLRAYGILQNSNPSILCGSWARSREHDITCHAPYKYTKCFTKA